MALLCSSPALAQLDDEKPPSDDEPAEDAAEDAPEDSAATSVEASLSTEDAEPGALEHWWLGAYWRHLWVPGYMLDAFLEQAPSIANNGFGLVGTYRTLEGFNIQFGIGYMPLSFEGPLLAPGSDITDIELASSDLGLVHVTSSVLWDIEFHSTIALEIGVGLDLGVFTGEMRRTEAYRDPMSNQIRACNGPLNPGNFGEDFDGFGPEPFVPYCDVPVSGGQSDPSSEEGEHYNALEEGIPPAFGFLMLPHIALRIQPWKFLAIKGEFAFGFATMFAGISLHASFGMLQKHPERVFERAEEAGANGRVLGRVLESGTDTPVAGATVTLKARALSPLKTLDDGRFVVDRLDAGEVRFDIEHEDYLPGHCEATVEDKGGDVHLICHVAARARVGSLSGQVKTENGKPIEGAEVTIDGPRSHKAESDEKGTFAAVDLPEGTYRLRVDAEGYLMQMIEIDVEAQDTAMPKVILIKKPKRSLVTLSKKEIVISQQVRFESNSAEIASSSDPLLREIADVFLRNPQVQLVEIQGHTDNTGSHDRNMTLSQERADAVRAWLVQAGVAESRLEAKGYGPDSPIAPNKSAADKAKNRRVQLIIRRQSAEVGGEDEEDAEEE